MQEHIERGLLKAEALQAIVFAPALGDFDALLQLSRDALATVPCAALGSKAQRAAAEQCGFSPTAFPALAEAPEDSGKRSMAMLRALPQGESSSLPLADISKPPRLCLPELWQHRAHYKSCKFHAHRRARRSRHAWWVHCLSVAVSACT